MSEPTVREIAQANRYMLMALLVYLGKRHAHIMRDLHAELTATMKEDEARPVLAEDMAAALRELVVLTSSLANPPAPAPAGWKKSRPEWLRGVIDGGKD